MSVTWTQLSLLEDDVVTHLTIQVGVVGSHHAQGQVDCRDEHGRLVSSVGWPHRDLVALDGLIALVLEECKQVILERHSPF